MPNSERFHLLRTHYPVFTYESYSYRIADNTLNIGFRFTLGSSVEFNPVAGIPLKSEAHRKAVKELEGTPLLESLIFHIGMIELVSYWKAACPPLVRIKPAFLAPAQRAFWKKIYFNGLGEFFHLNGIQADPETFMDIRPAGDTVFKPARPNLTDEYIIPVGGGKDSIVTLEVLGKTHPGTLPLIMNVRQATRNTVLTAGYTMDNVFEINRSIDPVLLQLNDAGYLNGHTPFSAMLAFYTLLAAAVSGKKNIALSNESSASEATIPGTHINHQYSKSLEFENDFRAYVREFISPAFNYFSFLRALNEYQIVGIFSSLPAYHTVFRSCNAGSKTDVWCGKCPKCLFAHVMLSAHLGVERANRIIGAKMLDDAEMKPYLDELSGRSANKPFECVGTIDEVNYALSRIRKTGDVPLLLKEIAPAGEELDMSLFHNEHNLNPRELELLTQALWKTS